MSTQTTTGHGAAGTGARGAIRVERSGDVVTVTLDRPEKRNALALDVMEELTAVLDGIGSTDALAVVLAAEGPVFSAGHNFGDMRGASLDDARHLFRVCTRMMDTLQAIPQPVVARVHALATAAGCQLVASCDLAIAAESAGFALPGGKGGLFCHTPLVAVARQVGRKRALEMALTGDVVDARTAEAWGLVNRVVAGFGHVLRARRRGRWRANSHGATAAALRRRAERAPIVERSD